VVNAEAAMLTAHADDLVNHVHAVFGNLRTSILLTNNLTDRLVPSLFDVEQ